ncbi:MAG: DUF4129 domain-containing protein [Candidatus Promineifilaceae bacterium]
MVEQPTMTDSQPVWQTFRDPLTAVWRFFRHEVLYILWALMEISLLAPVFLMALPWAKFWSPGIFTLWLLLFMLVPFNLIRVMSLINTPKDRQRLVLVGGLFIAVLFSLRALLYEPTSLVDFHWLGEFFIHTGQPENPLWGRDVAVFVIVCLTWWRGISLAGRSMDIGDIGVRFRFVSLFLAILVGGIAESLLPQPVTPFVLLFFFSSLMSIVLTRIEQLEMDHSGRSFPLGPRWVAVVALAASLVVFLIGVLAGFLGGTTIDGVVGWLAPLWQALHFLATAVLGMISYLSVPIIFVLEWLLKLLIGLLGPVLQQAFDNIELSTPAPVVDSQQANELIKATGSATVLPRQLITVLAMIFFILLISLAFSRLLRFLRPPSEIETETVSPLGNLPGGGLGFGRRLLNRLGFMRRRQTAASIRRIYQDMCSMAGSHGYPRLASETPYEYLPTLREAWPENSADTHLVTEAYNRVRYGEIPETQKELDEIKAAWKRLEAIVPEAGQPKDDLKIYAIKES